MGQTQPLYVYFCPFLNTMTYMVQILIIKRKDAFGWNSNPGQQDGRRRRIHWDKAASWYGYLLWVTWSSRLSPTGMTLIQILMIYLLCFLFWMCVKGSQPAWPVKSRQMSIKVAQNDFTRKMKDFNPFTKIALECRRFGQIKCCLRL